MRSNRVDPTVIPGRYSRWRSDGRRDGSSRPDELAGKLAACPRRSCFVTDGDSSMDALHAISAVLRGCSTLGDYLFRCTEWVVLL